MGLVKSLAKEMIKEIGNKSREFYEFVLPPVDIHLENDKLILLIDLPGFTKNDIKLSLDGNILSIQACKEISDEKNHNMICNQRPNIIDKKMRLPVEIDDAEKVNSAKYVDGVLTVIIPVKKHGKDISIE
ncbi:heat shock protein Hsp20 [Candidatus Nitrosarchaeum limnium SFB1]|jgi:HSP20 family protein|uniref:Heat shock protein Hsp20 n=1 Tax=Candidatus Nitrosarchaeum limnium SFB1 TaxID=886738 RepID=F3KLP9_9ARCH|nr:heat shock protein Hsp20 [Candidatus Nitrosarchaeum limnium SFB1]